MKIYFGETVRRLRRGKNLTQEQLAARLNVSFQTISKWERDESYPDITMLPVLASFFGVRTDDLLGVNQAENERRIQELIARYVSNTVWRGSDEMEEYIAPLKAMCGEFPNDYRLWSLYFGLLTSLNRDTAESLHARLPGIRTVYDSILEHCTNDAIRMEVKSCMCAYFNCLVWKDPDNTAKERALLEQIIDELPSLDNTKEYAMTMYSIKSGEDHATACRESIMEALGVLSGMITHLVNAVSEDGEDWNQIGVPFEYVKLELYRAAFPDGDYGKLFSNVMGGWQHVALGHAQAGEFDEAFAAMRQAVEHARRLEALPQVSEHTSPLFRGYVFDKNEQPWSTHAMGNIRSWFTGECGYTQHYPFPEDFKADPRFQQLLNNSQAT